MKKYFFLAFLFAFLCCSSIYAQPNMTLYQMHNIPQSNSLNPAVPIECGWIVGFPGLGGLSAGIGLPLSYNKMGAGDDVLHVDNILSGMNNKNIFAASANVNLITVGYRAERTFYQFTINERISQVSSISRDPVEMLLKGNAGYIGKIVSASPSINALYYREYGLNVAREIDPTFWVGARAKLLFGRLNIKSVNNTADFYTDPRFYDLSLTSDILIEASLPGKVEIDPVTGKVSDFNEDFKAGDFLFNPSNVGFGLDLGVTKEFDNGMQLSASLLNIGFIKWGKNTHTFQQKGTMNFDGPFSQINELDALTDTVKRFIKLDYTSQAGYSTMLSPMVMVGANYPVADFLRVGITGMAEMQPNALPWAITATGFTEGLPIVDLGISYTVTPYSFFNVGIGVGAHLGPVDIHFLTDNIMGAFRPFDASYTTVQLGLSFRFGQSGCNDDSRGGPSHQALPCPAINRYNYR